MPYTWFCSFFCRETDMRNSILAQVLDQSARARCKSICNVLIEIIVTIASITILLGDLYFIIIVFYFLVSNLALVKPDKANAVENYLIQMARFGKLGGKVASKRPYS